jgi:hypothetical protein
MGKSTLVCKNIAKAIFCCNQERLFANNGWMQNEIFTHPIYFDAELMEAMSCLARSKLFSKATSTWIDGHLEGAYPFASSTFIVFGPKHANDIPQIKQNPRSSDKIQTSRR